MDILGERLRARARELDLSNAEVARRAGLTERRYGHYVTGTREPDLQTLLRICTVLALTPNDLLGPGRGKRKRPERDRLTARLVAAANLLEVDDLRLAVAQVDAMVANRAKRSR